jgi:peptidoglycan DL-endopeptidase CwlO
MSIDTGGPMAVQSRIAAIQALFPRNTIQAMPSVNRSTDSGAGGFAAALAKLAPGASDASGASDALSGSPTSGAVTGDQVVKDARKYLGVPYVWGGTDPAKGLDCSALVQRVYKDLGIDLPRVSQDQARVGKEVPSLAQAKPGDLVCFGTPADHIGIYIGNNKMIVAPKAGDVVKVQDVYRTPSTIRRVLPESSALVSSVAQSQGTGISASTGSGSSGSSSRAMAAAPAAYKTLFEQAGRRYGVAPDLLAAVAQTESGFNPRAVSGAGAQGLMQLMPGTARSLGVDPSKPAEAIDGAARLLSQHLRQFGSTSLALAAYNAGPGAVTRYHGVPPYAETRSYVAKVLAATGGSV